MPVYRKLGDGRYDGITRIACLQHIKRKFIDIKGVPEAAGILRLFNLLYDREHRHRIGHDGWTAEDNLKWCPATPLEKYRDLLPDRWNHTKHDKE